jgi:hypothetical protein
MGGVLRWLLGYCRTITVAPGFALLLRGTPALPLAIMAAIVSPSLAKAREKARQTSCLSNMRQLGGSILMYVQDFDDTFPNGINRGRLGIIWAGAGWAGQCHPYYKSAPLLRCLSDAHLGPGGEAVVSYGININVIRYNDQRDYAVDPNAPRGNSVYISPGVASGANENDGTIPSGHTLAEFSAPSRSVLLFEVSGVSSNVADPREGMVGDGVPGSRPPATVWITGCTPARTSRLASSISMPRATWASGLPTTR